MLCIGRIKVIAWSLNHDTLYINKINFPFTRLGEFQVSNGHKFKENQVVVVEIEDKIIKRIMEEKI